MDSGDCCVCGAWLCLQYGLHLQFWLRFWLQFCLHLQAWLRLQFWLKFCLRRWLRVAA